MINKWLGMIVLLFVGSVNAALISGSGSLDNHDIDDYFFSTSATGLITIETFKGVVNPRNFDTEINLFYDDGVLDLSDFIKNDDDNGTSGGSLISIILDAGDYLLRVGTYPFGNIRGTSSVIIAATNPGGRHGVTNYDITFRGDFLMQNTTPVPAPMSIFLLGLALVGFWGSAKKQKK